jgi:hypothetical protein
MKETKVSLFILKSLQTIDYLAATLSFLNESIALANCMTDMMVSNLAQDVNCRDVILYCIDLYTNYQSCS